MPLFTNPKHETGKLKTANNRKPCTTFYNTRKRLFSVIKCDNSNLFIRSSEKKKKL